MGLSIYFFFLSVFQHQVSQNQTKLNQEEQNDYSQACSKGPLHTQDHKLN